MPVRKTPSNVPAPPIDATGAPSSAIRPRLRKSAPGAIVVALNVGGALIPILVSIYLFARTRLYWRMLLGTAVVAAVVHSLARVVPGVGIAVPMLARTPLKMDQTEATPKTIERAPLLGFRLRTLARQG